MYHDDGDGDFDRGGKQVDSSKDQAPKADAPDQGGGADHAANRAHAHAEKHGKGREHKK